MPTPLSGRVAVVAGATRGAGRGIARMLGEAGATVYCTGRSSRVQPNVSSHVNAGRPETIEETADMVTADGGTGIPVRVDHTVEDQVVPLFERVGREQGRLDVLAIVMTGQPASWKSFLEETPAEGRTFVDGWIWPHVMTAWHGANLMVQQRAGLIVELVEQDNIGYHGAFYFDLMETLLKRLVFGLANDLGKSGLTAVAVAPGFMRTEAILEGFSVTEANWRDALGNPQAAEMGWGGSRRHVSSAVRWPHLRQTPTSHERMAVSTQPGRFRRNTDSPILMASAPTTPCSTRPSSRPRGVFWLRWSTPAGSRRWTGSWLRSWRCRHDNRRCEDCHEGRAVIWINRPIRVLANALFFLCLVMAWPVIDQQPEIATMVASLKARRSIERATSISPTLSTNAEPESEDMR